MAVHYLHSSPRTLLAQRLRQLRGLAAWEQRILFQLLILLPIIGAALRVLDVKRTCRLLARGIPKQRAVMTPTSEAEVASKIEHAHRIAHLVSIAARHGPYRATCLRRSLALWWLLRRRGIPAEIRIGVRKDQGKLDAHAWVEHNGQALNEIQGVTARYTPFMDSLPTATANHA